MCPILLLFPTKDISEKIKAIRKTVVDQKLGNIDDREKVLPHLTLVYTKEGFNEKVTSRLEALFNSQPKFQLPMEKLDSWENKIALLFDKKLLKGIIARLEEIFSETGISFEKTGYDLMDLKVVRQVFPVNIEKVKTMITTEMPQIITFDKVALLDTDGQEKDIIWQQELI